jgi:hypothetical protein
MVGFEEVGGVGAGAVAVAGAGRGVLTAVPVTRGRGLHSVQRLEPMGQVEQSSLHIGTSEVSVQDHML